MSPPPPSSLSPPTVPSSSTLVTALRVDALLVAAFGLIVAALSAPIGDLLDIDSTVLRVVGLLLLPWAAFVTLVGRQDPPTRAGALTVIGGNLLWVVASVTVLLTDLLDPNGLGIAFVLLQAMLVLALAVWQAMALNAGEPASPTRQERNPS